jgi:hypothetical protein
VTLLLPPAAAAAAGIVTVGEPFETFSLALAFPADFNDSTALTNSLLTLLPPLAAAAAAAAAAVASIGEPFETFSVKASLRWRSLPVSPTQERSQVPC